MTHLTKGLQEWLEKATLKWLVVLAVVVLRFSCCSVISHRPSPGIAGAGLSDPEQWLGPVPVCSEISSCHS